MAEALPKSTSELLTVIEKEWQELMRVVDRLTPEQMLKTDAEAGRRRTTLPT